MIETEALVIGAGAAGLSAARALGRVGVAARVIEKAPCLGEPWRTRHKHLTLNTHRDLSALPGAPYPSGTSAFPSRHAVIALLEEFTDQNGLEIDFGVDVERVERAGELWRVRAGNETYLAEHVIVATGRDRIPFIPDWPGRESFAGKLVHAADFGEAANYRGQSVLVVGAGNSGFDVLNHLARERTGALWLSARHATAILPKRLCGMSVHRWSSLLSLFPLTAADAAISGIQRLAFGDLGKFGLPKKAGGGASRLCRDSVAIATDDGAVDAIKRGRVTIVPEISSIHGDRVRLAGGCIVKPDVVIAATGYRAGLEDMVGHLGVLDQSGRPRFNGRAADRSNPGLWFTGMRTDLRGYFVCAAKAAEEIADTIALQRSRPVARKREIALIEQV